MILELNEATKTYDEFKAVDRLSLSIPKGSVFGLLGPNGAGKTSSIRMMIGITVPDSGSVKLFGEPFRRELLLRVGYLPEERGMYKRMKVGDQLIFFAGLKGVSEGEARRRSQQWLERLDLAKWANSKVEELSKGMQQKVQFISAVLHQPEFMILDEPFSGLDPENALELKNILLEMKKEGRTILFSTHRMDTVEKLCDSICLINAGRSVLQGDLKKVKASFGRSNVQMEYEGDVPFLNDRSLIVSANNYGNFVELKMQPGVDPQQLLARAMQTARINRFELAEPSLEQIFIETVQSSKAGASNA